MIPQWAGPAGMGALSMLAFGALARGVRHQFRGRQQPAPKPASAALEPASRATESVAPSRNHTHRPRTSALARMSPAEQAQAFIGWIHAYGYVGRHSCSDVVEFAEWWAEETKIARTSDSEFLAALKRHTAVTVSRERLRDSTGRVMKLQSGVPMRQVFYTIAAALPATTPESRAERVHPPVLQRMKAA